MKRCRHLCWEINQTDPDAQKKIADLEKELIADQQENCFITPPFQIDVAKCLHLGKSVFVNTGILGKVYVLNNFDPIKEIPNGVYLTGFFSNYPTGEMMEDIFRFKIESKHRRSEELAALIKSLEEADGPVQEFSERQWGEFVDHVTVFTKKDIRVTMKDGSEIYI